MDKEAQEKIMIHCPYCDAQFYAMDRDIFVVQERIGLCFVNCKGCGQTIGIDEELGYHKLPEGEPPLLDEIDIQTALKEAEKFWASTKNEDEQGLMLKNLEDIEPGFIAQAQWDICVKHFREGLNE